MSHHDTIGPQVLLRSEPAGIVEISVPPAAARRLTRTRCAPTRRR